MPGEGQGFAIRAAVFSAAILFAAGIYLPFFPIWLAARGLSEAEIGTIVAAPLLVRIVLLPLLVAAADRMPSLRFASALYALIATLFIAALAPLYGYWPILLASTAALVFSAAIGPLSDAVILAGTRAHGIDYARVRLWGSVGFIAGNLAAAAAVERFADEAILAALVAANLVGFAAALALPRVPAVAVAGEPFGIRRVFADPTLRPALIAGSLVLGSNGAYYAFGSLFWQSHGFSGRLIGGLWAFSVVAEIALFWAAKLLPGWGARRFIMVACAGALVRWLLFPFATSPGAALALQALHAATYGLAHLGVMMAIGAFAAEGNTARLQAAYALLNGLFLAFTMAAAGPLFRLSPIAAFWAMAVFALPALFLAAGLPRGLQPQSSGRGGSTSAPE